MVKNEWMFNFRVEEINPFSISGWVDRYGGNASNSWRPYPVPLQ
jgi:hypothetical protein